MSAYPYFSSFRFQSSTGRPTQILTGLSMAGPSFLTAGRWGPWVMCKSIQTVSISGPSYDATPRLPNASATNASIPILTAFSSSMLKEI